MNCLSNMKRSFRSLLIPAACVFLVTGNLSTGVAGEVDGAFPVGWLQVTTSGLVIGTRPNMSWKVVPSTIESQVQLASSGRFSLLRDALMAVRVVGVSVLDGSVVEDALTTLSKARVEIQVQVNGGGYLPIFSDTSQTATPDKVAYQRAVSASDSIDVGARYQRADGSWSDWRSTTNTDGQIKALKNGDSVPEGLLTGLTQNYLKPYLDLNGKVQIGPNDLLLLLEIDASNPAEPAFDRQDAVLLVSFGDVFP